MRNGFLETNYDRSTRELFSITGSIDFTRLHQRAIAGETQIVVTTAKYQKEENNLKLKGIIRKYKIKSIVANFIQKVKRISVSSKPVLV